MTVTPKYIPDVWVDMIQTTLNGPVVLASAFGGWSRAAHSESRKYTRRYLLSRRIYGWLWRVVDRWGWDRGYLDALDDDWPSVSTATEYRVRVYDETEAEFLKRAESFPRSVTIPSIQK